MFDGLSIEGNAPNGDECSQQLNVGEDKDELNLFVINQSLNYNNDSNDNNFGKLNDNDEKSDISEMENVQISNENFKIDYDYNPFKQKYKDINFKMVIKPKKWMIEFDKNDLIGSKNKYIFKKRHREYGSKKNKKKIFFIDKDKKGINSKNTKTDITNSKTNDNFIVLINSNISKTIDALIPEEREPANKEKFFSPGDVTNEIGRLIKDTINKNINKTSNLFEIKRLKKIEKQVKKGKGRDEMRADNMRKKAKTTYFGRVRKILNINLIIAKSKYQFDYFPQLFVSDVSKEKNCEKVLNTTFIELIKKNFFVKNKVGTSDYEKSEYNKKVLEYLDKNKDISAESKFDLIKEMTYSELYKEYLNSKEFEMDIEKLMRKFDYNYIKKYICIAYNLLDFFTSKK